MPSQTLSIQEFSKKKSNPVQRPTASSTAPAMTPQASNSMSISEFSKKKTQSSVAPSETYPVPEKRDGFLETIVKDPLETLLVKPADRTAEALGRLGLFGKTIKTGYEAMADEGKGRRIFGMDIEPQRSWSDGGAKQIGGEALKTASYLYTGGKAAPAASAVMKSPAIPTLNAVFQGAKVGAIGGGAYGAGEEMTRKESTVGSVLAEGAVGAGVGAGAGGALGVAAPQIAKVISPAQRALRREGEITDALKRVAVSPRHADYDSAALTN